MHYAKISLGLRASVGHVLFGAVFVWTQLSVMQGISHRKKLETFLSTLGRCFASLFLAVGSHRKRQNVP